MSRQKIGPCRCQRKQIMEHDDITNLTGRVSVTLDKCRFNPDDTTKRVLVHRQLVDHHTVGYGRPTRRCCILGSKHTGQGQEH